MHTQIEFLLDPARYGEDLFEIANRAFELAPRLCGDCLNYHMHATAARIGGMQAGLASDRELVASVIRQVLASTEVARRGDPTIAIIGSADTGLIATCAHAAAQLGESALERTKFIVVDLCPTPLALCREFAARHRISIETQTLDIVTQDFEHSADIVLMHSLLRFLPSATHAQVLRKLGLSLRSGGKLIVSNHVASSSKTNSNKIDQRREMALNKVLGHLQNGNLRSEKSLEELRSLFEQSLLASQNRNFGIDSMDTARALFEASGLFTDRAEINLLQSNGENGLVGRHRLLAVLSLETCPAKQQHK